jgi:DNA helicase-2/ATP-dependent DNA helicase PcrA
MGNNDYLESLMNELAAQGIEPPKNDTVNKVENIDDKDLKIILDMQRITGREFSDEQKRILKHHGNACILACAGSGKALVNGTGVFTPDGYRPIEQLNIGDKVFDEKGHEQLVIGVFPQGKKNVYKIYFNNGEIIKCCKDHLWTVLGNDGYWRVMNTSDIKELLKDVKEVSLPRMGLDHRKLFVEPVVGSVDLESYLNTVSNLLPSLNRIVELIDNENNDLLLKGIDYINVNCYRKENKLSYLYYMMYWLMYHVVIINNKELADTIRIFMNAFGFRVPVDENEDNTYKFHFDSIKYDVKITKIEEVEDETADMTCISVTGESQLFMTENFIPTHNTTISVNLIAKRILTGEIRDVNKLIYTTFSKAGAEEMKDRLDKLLAQLGMSHVNVQVRTLHSFFLSVIRTFGLNKRIVSASERTKMVRQACKDAEYPLKDDDLMVIDNLLSYQINNLLTNKKLVDSYVNTLEDLDVEKYTKINNSYRNQKAVADCMDYDDMQYFLWQWLVKWAKSEDPQQKETAISVRNYCKAVYTDFYIDEAQDVSKIQFEIIKAIVSDPDNPNKLDKNLVFIGDDDQCIYEWRGSDPSIILTIGAEFNMPTFVLSTNYRCLNEVVDYAATGIKCNNSRYNKSMIAHNKGGTVKIYPSMKEDLCSLSILAMNQIKYWLAHGDKVSDIAVLSRNNFHLAILSNMLLREGIYCNMTEDMKLTKSYMYSDVKDIMALSETSWKSDLTAKVLWRLCKYMGAGNARAFAKFQDSCALSLEDTLGYLLKHFVNKDMTFNKKLNIPMQAEQQMQYQMSKLSKDTIDDMQVLYNTLLMSDKIEKTKTLLYQYISSSSFMYKSKDKNRSITGLVKYMINLMTKDGYDKMLEFLRVTEQLEGGKMVIPGDKVTLTTIHSAKGREWKNVIMFGCDNVSQPSFDGIYGMIQDDIPVGDIFGHIDEERRLFYVGNTRAKENLFVITYSKPSVFILEALGAFENEKSGGNDATIVELVSDEQWQERYKDIIQEKIYSPDSKYFYNPDDYKI